MHSADLRWGDDHARGVTVRAVDGEVEVALLGLRRQAGARAAALGIDDDDGDFRHRGEAERFGHQREAGSCGRGHGLDARPGCAEAGIDGGDFVLTLEERPADGRQFECQLLHDVRGRGDRVATIEAAACPEGTGDDRIVPVHNQAVAIAARFGKGEAEAIRLHQRAGMRVSGIEGVEVTLQELRAPTELLGDCCLRHLFIEAEELGDRANDDDVLAALRPRLVRQFDGGHLVLRAHEPRRWLVFRGVENERAVRSQVVMMERPRFLVESDQHIDLIADREDGRRARVELEEHRPPPDLCGEGAEGVDPCAMIRRDRRDDITDGHHTIAGLTADPENKIRRRRRRTHAAPCLLVVPSSSTTKNGRHHVDPHCVSLFT